MVETSTPMRWDQKCPVVERSAACAKEEERTHISTPDELRGRKLAQTVNVDMRILCRSLDRADQDNAQDGQPAEKKSERGQRGAHCKKETEALLAQPNKKTDNVKARCRASRGRTKAARVHHGRERALYQERLDWIMRPCCCGLKLKLWTDESDST